MIEGEFDTGLTRDLKTLLASTTDIETVMLKSNGGRVFEARGVARQIVENNLDTSVLDHCRSACSIAFMAGRVRKLGERAQIGFHSYRMEPSLAFVDPLEEQEKDKAFFATQGVQPGFIERAFDAPHEDMWHPDVDTLLRAGVVHDVLTDR